MDPAPITTKRIARATRLHVRPRGAPNRALALLRVARGGVTEGVLAAQLVHGPPRELDDLLVRQVAEVRADLFALLAEAEEVLLDDVLVRGPLLARHGLPDEPLLEGQVPERGPRVRRREEEDLGLEVDLLTELDRLAYGVGGLAGRGDHERAAGVAEHALGLLDRDLHLLERLPALVDGLEDLGARRLDAVAGLAHPDLVALLEHVRPALTPGAQNVVGDDVGAARAAPHDLEAGPPLALAQLAEELEGPAVVRHEKVVEEVDVDDPIARLDELHLVHDLARAAQPIGFAEVRRVTIITRARGVRAAPRGDHRDGVLPGRHRSAVDPLRLPVEVADGVQLVHLVLGPPRAERPRQRIEPLLARGDGRAEAVVAHRPLAAADRLAVRGALDALHRGAALQPVQHLGEGDLALLLHHDVHGETLDHELGHRRCDAAAKHDRHVRVDPLAELRDPLDPGVLGNDAAAPCCRRWSPSVFVLASRIIAMSASLGISVSYDSTRASSSTITCWPLSRRLVETTSNPHALKSLRDAALCASTEARGRTPSRRSARRHRTAASSIALP